MPFIKIVKTTLLALFCICSVLIYGLITISQLTLLLRRAHTCTNYHRKLSKLHTWLRTIPFLAFVSLPHMCSMYSCLLSHLPSSCTRGLQTLILFATVPNGLEIYYTPYHIYWKVHSIRACIDDATPPLLVCPKVSVLIDNQCFIHIYIYFYSTIILSAVKNEPRRRVN